MKITACLIARNEAAVLDRCLQSIANFVDELCVIDSGSTDQTVDIARRFGACVKIEPSLADRRGRMNNFADARNAVLAMATGHWLLTIDADEVLEISDEKALREFMANDRLNAIELRILSGGTRWYLPRLVRRMPWTRWHGRVHEWVEIEGAIRRSDAATIENLPDKRGKESSTARDLRLCRLALRDDPDDLRSIFYLARALRCNGQYRDAIPHYERYWLESSFQAGRYSAALGAAVCFLLLHELKPARRAAMRAYRSDPKMAEACCVLGDVSLGLGRPDLAAEWFRRATTKRIPGRSYPLFVDPSSYNAYPKAQLQWINDELFASNGSRSNG